MSGFEVVADQAVDEAEWLAARRGRVTATDVAKIMTGGAGAWATLKRTKAHGASFHGNRFTEWGHEREPLIVAFLTDLFELRPNSCLLARVDEPSHAATPDAMNDDVSMLGEVKTTVHDWPGLVEGDGSLESFHANRHADYWWQMQWQMYVTGATATAFAYELQEDFIPAWPEPRVVLVDRDDAAVAEALAKVDEWSLFDPEGEDAPDGLDGLLSLRTLLKDAATVAADRVAAVDDQIRALLVAGGRPVKFEGSDANVSWSGKPVTSVRFDSTAFKKADPGTYQKFTKTTEAQPRLTITARS